MNDLGAAKDAIQAWAAAQTGIDIIWADEDAPQPPWPFGRLRVVSGPIPIGNVDEIRLDTDLGQANGSEVGQTVVGQRRLVVSLQIMNRRDLEDAYDAAADPDSLIAKAQTSLRLPTVMADFYAAELAVLNVGDPVNLSGIESDEKNTARASLDITFGLAFEVAERTGYINEALVTSTTGAPAGVELDDEPLGG